MLYFSYGMNTNAYQMACRCPEAKDLGRAILLTHTFEFKGHATIDESVTDQVYGVLWDITDNNEKSLDLLEGYPYYYNKKEVTVLHNRKLVTAMTYFMYSDEKLSMPATHYFDMLKEGYLEHNIPLHQIEDAFDRAEVAKYDRDELTNYAY